MAVFVLQIFLLSYLSHDSMYIALFPSIIFSIPSSVFFFPSQHDFNMIMIKKKLPQITVNGENMSEGP